MRFLLLKELTTGEISLVNIDGIDIIFPDKMGNTTVIFKNENRLAYANSFDRLADTLRALRVAY